MKTYTERQVENKLMDVVLAPDICEKDNQGQLCYYSGVFVWKDGTFHDEAESDDQMSAVND